MSVQKKILVTDDQSGVRKLLYEVFRREGYGVMLAADGHEALQLAMTETPDLILMDVKMPGMDGLETLKRIRGMGIRTCVILMTAYGETDIIKEAIQLGHVRHITKPFDLNDLKKIAREQMEERFGAQS